MYVYVCWWWLKYPIISLNVTLLGVYLDVESALPHHSRNNGSVYGKPLHTYVLKFLMSSLVESHHHTENIIQR